MSLRLRNQNNTKKTLSMSDEAWFSILELAEEYGWNPMGTVLPEWWLEQDPVLAQYGLYDMDGLQGDYSTTQGGLVMLEDALNLADALDRAFLDYEPRSVHPLADISPAGLIKPAYRLRPSIGAITALMQFCQLGAFQIETCG